MIKWRREFEDLHARERDETKEELTGLTSKLANLEKDMAQKVADGISLSQQRLADLKEHILSQV